jgi:imidazole glycerol phosphate synthase glutamine amidotransferase subunit
VSGTVTLVPTGTANTASVIAGLRRLGVDARFADGPDDIRDAGRVVLPGVGAFGAAMQEIDEQGLREPLTGRIREGRPTLAICLGLQLFAAASEESPGIAGLGVIPATIARLPDDLIVPHLGWNEVAPNGESRFVHPGWAYFANSYRLTAVPDGWAGSWTEYGTGFVSAIERGDVLAAQFHPELSGRWGSQLLGRWLDATGSVS